MTAPERPDPAALRRLLAALPAGDLPLSIYPDALEWEKEIVAADGSPIADIYDRDTEPAVDRAELIVAAVNALGPLLDRLEALEAALAEIEALPDALVSGECGPEAVLGRCLGWLEAARIARAALAGAGDGARP